MTIQRSVTALVFSGLLLSGCATHVAGARPASPISVFVTAAPGVDAGAAARMRAIVEQSIRRTVRDGQPLLVSIALTPKTVRGGLAVSATRRAPTFLQVTEADYALTDSDGFVLDAGSIAIPAAEVGYSSLDPMHIAADTIATRIASLHH